MFVDFVNENWRVHWDDDVSHIFSVTLAMCHPRSAHCMKKTFVVCATVVTSFWHKASLFKTALLANVRQSARYVILLRPRSALSSCHAGDGADAAQPEVASEK